ncbi:hypothetical protein GGC64_005921 [Mycobacterium sp. OAS707]|uniref:hypothetical protein n=1 Tax=Mycobacterium sp. OAS707 TaxID=2663822 RepID=UPI001788F68D|nr:hypothetical protein [Mycobacterium sp. OAS707]MBE1551834.1 hypothetical protein [Mycobacterium sp. OAS707]
MTVTTAKSEITAAEHTKVMQAFMQYPLHVVHYLATPKGQAPTEREVLEAALQVRAFDDEVRDVVQRALDMLPAITAQKDNVSGEVREALDQLEEDIQNKSLDDVIKVVQATRARVPQLADNLAFVEEMYQDGADTIYSPLYPPAEFLYPRHFAFDATSFLLGVGLADGLGGAIAGGGGALVASTTGTITAIILEA